MNSTSGLALVPLLAVVAGGGLGFLAGRFLSGRALLWLLGTMLAVSLILILRLSDVSEGEEAQAFLPLALLTGAVFPATFGGIAGALAGRSMQKRQS